MRMIVVFSLVLLAMAIAPSAGASPVGASDARAVVCPGKDPATVIRSYYRASTRADAPHALACLSLLMGARFRRVPFPDWKNIASFTIRSMTQRAVSGKQRPPGTRTEAVVMRVVVRYVARYRRLVGQQNGPGIEYVYVGKETAGSSWRIVSIDTRP